MQNLLREIAEYPNSFGPLGPEDERIETDRFTLCIGPGRSFNTVQRQRFDATEVDDVLEEVRSLLRSRSRTSTQWEIGSHAEPDTLVDLLLDRGLVRDKDPYAVALILKSEPPPCLTGIRARRVATLEEFIAANDVQAHAFAMSKEETLEDRAILAERWRSTPNLMHAAWIDDAMVCAGTSAPTEHGLLLYGGGTLPSARGRGAYRGLIRARWDDAVARNTPALLTQAGSMSLPILLQIGFEAVGHIHLLLDEFDRQRGPHVVGPIM